MKNIIFIDENLNQLKGNLHTHTNKSDGMFNLSEVALKYKNDGYNFLAITDHNKLFNGSNKIDNMTIIPGIEISSDYDGFNQNLKGTYMHFNLFFNKTDEELKFKVYTYTNSLELQPILNDLQKYNALIQFNHPLFSRLSEDTIFNLNGFDLIEIYNTKDFFSEVGVDSSDCLMLSMLRNGKKILFTANDDYHGKSNLSEDNLCRQSFSVVQGENTVDNILNRIKQGNFYTSNGPVIYDYRLENNVLKIKTENVKYITFYSSLRHSKKLYSDTYINYGEYTINGDEKFVWVVIVDSNGNKAWTQPYYI